MSTHKMARRAMLATSGLAFIASRTLFAEELMRKTPSLTEGPFYPDRLPLDQDNDLIVVNDNLTPAIGDITHLTGRVLTRNGSPVRNVTVEIWQCDAKQVYLHSRDSVPKANQIDPNFQGFGRFETASDGGYRFRTIKPVPYPGRPAPHIHIKVKQGDRELLTSQILMKGYEGNAQDGVFRSIRAEEERALLLAEWKPIADPKAPAGEVGKVEYSATFDIILGITPDERELIETKG